MKEKLTIVKVGGKIVEEADTLSQLLADFSAIPGYKLLVHGGGRSVGSQCIGHFLCFGSQFNILRFQLLASINSKIPCNSQTISFN